MVAVLVAGDNFRMPYLRGNYLLYIGCPVFWVVMSAPEGQGDASELFDASRYPNLRKVAYHASYGRMELIEVNETSDGFLIGEALIGKGEGQYMHSVFLGTAIDYKAPGS